MCDVFDMMEQVETYDAHPSVRIRDRQIQPIAMFDQDVFLRGTRNEIKGRFHLLSREQSVLHQVGRESVERALDRGQKMNADLSEGVIGWLFPNRGLEARVSEAGREEIFHLRHARRPV